MGSGHAVTPACFKAALKGKVLFKSCSRVGPAHLALELQAAANLWQVVLTCLKEPFKLWNLPFKLFFQAGAHEWSSAFKTRLNSFRKLTEARESLNTGQAKFKEPAQHSG